LQSCASGEFEPAAARSGVFSTVTTSPLKNHLGQRPPVGVETAEVYTRDGRERPTAFWWQITPQKNMVHGLLRT
jgi:hypothetical protein